MKIHIERNPKKKNAKKRVLRVGTHKKSVLFLWLLLGSSLIFGLYKNFTAIDQHTTEKIVKVQPINVDTHAVESFTKNFVEDYYSWENKKEVLEQRTEKIKHYVTPQLQELLADSVRSDIPTSSKVVGSQIWQVQAKDQKNYFVVYSVQQEISEGKKKNTTNSTFRIQVHQDQEQNLVITQSPTIWKVSQHSDYQAKEPSKDTMVDEKNTKEITSFLETFFKLYPIATQSELSYYVQKGVLPLIDKDLLFSEINHLTIRKERGKDKYQVYVSVIYLDSITKSKIVCQYQLNLKRSENWKIVAKL